ncbi:MAG: hypothetical protein M1825_000455 [Sarcosagium campestre]|nr:MAG: hypothetical protein M1825_000455 [Sarcosagium campestre]
MAETNGPTTGEANSPSTIPNTSPSQSQTIAAAASSQSQQATNAAAGHPSLQGNPPPQSTAATSKPSAPAPAPPQPSTPLNGAMPSTYLTDPGSTTKRPRDARLIHMVLAAMGINAYQERVPLQLLDFAYRYSSSTLQDALHLSSDGPATAGGGASSSFGPSGGARDAGGAAGGGGSIVTLPALRLSVASRMNYQYQASLPKEFLLDLANERNRIALPLPGKEYGVRLPPEKYCLTGVGWELKEEWTSEGEEEVDGDEDEGHDQPRLDDGEDGDERMEDIFGDDENHVPLGDGQAGRPGGGEDAGEEDRAMEDV